MTDRTSERGPLGPLKLLADGTRLRILGLLEREELSVGELSRALGMAQSRVSNHLRLLREAGLLSERHAGASTFLRLAGGEGLAPRLWATLREDLAAGADHAADAARLAAVLAERREHDTAFFDRLAGNWDKVSGDFETGQGRQRAALRVLARPLTVADVGCGAGYMGAAFEGLVERLILIDPSPAMLREAERRLAGWADPPALEFRQGSFEALPLADGEVDGLVAGLVLHHLPTPEAASGELRRVLAPGGRAAVLELFPHREAWMHEQLGDRHLGLEPAEVLRALARAGFGDLAVETVADRYRPRRTDGEAASLPLYLVRGRAPSVSEPKTPASR